MSDKRTQLMIGRLKVLENRERTQSMIGSNSRMKEVQRGILLN